MKCPNLVESAQFLNLHVSQIREQRTAGEIFLYLDP